MSLALLFDHFAAISRASGGVVKLKETILQLAMQGKLVPQDPNDEPVEELLKRIQAEKAKLVAEGTIKKDKPLPAILEKEVPYALRYGWQWVQLYDVTENIHYGYTASSVDSNTGVRLLRITDIQNNMVQWERVPYCFIEDEKVKIYCLRNNDLLIARTGGTIGKSYLVSDVAPNTVFASYLIRLVPLNIIVAQYIKRFLESPVYWTQLYSQSQGTGQPNVSATSLKQIRMPLPSIAEQHRIVDKIEELFTLCDQLEDDNVKQAEKQQYWVESTIYHLLSAPNTQEFSRYWEHITEHFDALISTPKAVKELRQAILQLAVQGKLVPQDADDEATEELVKRVQAEKEQLIKDGKIKKGKPLTKIMEDEIPYELPDGWQWVRLGTIAEIITSGSRDWAKYYSSQGAKFIRMGNLSQESFGMRLANVQHISLPESGEGMRTKLIGDDILISITGDVGWLGLVPHNFGEAYINQHVCLVRLCECVRGTYYPYTLLSNLCKMQFNAPQRGIKNSFRLTDIEQMLVPLPPLAEQNRIVKKVEQLTRQCEQLEEQLLLAEEKGNNFLEAICYKIGAQLN